MVDLHLLETWPQRSAMEEKLNNDDPVWLARWTIHQLHQQQQQEYSHSELDQLIHSLDQATDRWIDLTDARQEETLQHASEAHCARWVSIQIQARWEAYNQIYLSPDHSLQDGLPSFFSFYQTDLNELALSFASQLELGRLRRLIETGELRLDIRDIFGSIPLHARTSDSIYGQDLIALLPRPTPHLTKPWSPTRQLLAAFFDPDRLTTPPSLSDQQLTDWYLSRVEAIDEFTGAIDAAIEIVQHGAASGVAGLESIAEDLSLLSKLTYDLPTSSISVDDGWTLKEWRSKLPDEIVQAYLSASSPTTLIKDVRRLVLPYLGVLESRRARASIPGAESTIPDALRTWALNQSNQLLMLEALINASSPTLKLPERLIKSNRDLAQILIACLYTSSSVEEWECMGRMFECMPAFPDRIPSSDEFNPANYLHELLVNHQADSSLWTPGGTRRVYEDLAQLDIGRLSSILDGLDDHLTTAEVLARWNVPVTLAELVIKFHQNKTSQQKLATRIARQDGGIDMESEEEWEVLLEAMIELSQPGRALDLLNKNEDFFELTCWLLSACYRTQEFKLAKSLLSSSVCDSLLDASIQEELVIAASREFYDNAEIANLHTGEMKMAYDCLGVAPQTLNIKREREFIEASCRLASFKLESQPGILMSPIEIRLKPNKLELISQLLDVSRTAYQQQDMIVDLVNKLGYGEDLLVQIKALSMVVGFATAQKHDLSAACLACERMISILDRIKTRSRKRKDSLVEEASEVIWKTSEKVGKYSAVSNPSSSGLRGYQGKFLAHAITICPPDQIPRLLIECKAAEIRQVEEDEEEERKTKNQDLNDSFSNRPLWHSIELHKSFSDTGPAASSSLSANNHGLPGADLASRTLERAASLFPFNHNKSTAITQSEDTPSSNTSHPPSSDSRVPPSDPAAHRDFSRPLAGLLDLQNNERFVNTDRLTAALSHKFTSGVGWLIGANEDDLNH